MVSLAELGERICILGPSNSGKSTLASAISQRCALTCIHLDQLYHLPGSDCTSRPAADFVALHDAAIAADRWVLDGNYSSLLPRRLERATGFILLDVSTITSLFRYLRRTSSSAQRFGGLPGDRDSIKLSMLHHIAVVTPGNRARYAEMYKGLVLPRVRLASARAIRRQYREWHLQP